ncbi:acyl-CoA synthetase [Trinickia caryophylli]|uniref:Fatty-acyl-CoA synthase n=1 Tax=Trinickia caryophylli TaxID=28094 RepID=A0A1X7H9A0_TRICW|nr:acyl-CoA synthetase [Trinickia caryophylli]PMS09001.1 acyl-CoA synthetase [Trinickia caryophylli]TRX15040.1 acyl-CoA synthetase [Trinickia caryophylli]WQE14899.1 acyl-CoA synthetase [Trinickia caryophylli]SMF82061.1 fatty-acyl-CoA synthase [Trinickia caryophylli]GLU35797.1 acyl-CoA synthetase [Trinickia caryophylli]
MSKDMYEAGLGKNAANFTALTPLKFIARSAAVYPSHLAVVHGNLRRTWAETYARTRRLASALAARGIGLGDTVAVMLPNVPAMVEAHFGVPMTGAVLNTLNTRLDAATLAFMLNHGEAKALLVDREFAPLMRSVLPAVERPILVIDVDDPVYEGPGERIGEIEYEALLETGDPEFAWELPSDEWNAISLNYTSGTTGNPKGVVYHHRGAYTNAISNILEWDMPKHAVYLWTLPMFHCNGWCFPWTVAARAGVNVCLRKVEAKAIFDLIRLERVTHYCGAPIVHNMLVNAPDELKAGIEHRVSAMLAGAAPPAALIESLERLGFDLTHTYGLTEVYGPASVCAQQDDWRALDVSERARLNARQGVPYHLQDSVAVLNPETMEHVPADGETIGEVMFRGNIAMKGYLKNPTATEEAFRGGWFHTGDLGVIYPDGYVRIKDRSKDIIISGGENISSIEVEDVLYRHADVLAAAVVAKPDARWGETPCAFVELKAGATATADDLIAHCKAHLAGFKVPRAVEFCELPKTSTGKIQKFELRKRARSVAAIDV